MWVPCEPSWRRGAPPSPRRTPPCAGPPAAPSAAPQLAKSVAKRVPIAIIQSEETSEGSSERSAGRDGSRRVTTGHDGSRRVTTGHDGSLLNRAKVALLEDEALSCCTYLVLVCSFREPLFRERARARVARLQGGEDWTCTRTGLEPELDLNHQGTLAVLGVTIHAETTRAYSRLVCITPAAPWSRTTWPLRHPQTRLGQLHQDSVNYP
eukprot:1185278-Prorocentrum_minimum.AAC.1